MHFWNLDLVSGTLGIPSGGGGCAAHVPPRCRVEKKSLSECQDGSCAATHALFRSKHRGVQNRGSRGLNSSPEKFKIESEIVRESQDASKRRPRASKRHPRLPKRHPRLSKAFQNRNLGAPKSSFFLRGRLHTFWGQNFIRIFVVLR